MDDVHNKGVSLPMAARVSHPKIQRSLEMRSSVRIDSPIGAAVLESHPDVIGRLEYLKRKRHIHDARHPEQKSFRIRVGGRTVLEILPLLWERLRRYGSSLPSTTPWPAGMPSRAE